MCLKLKKGAIFIADSHYPNHKAKEFLKLLNAINQGLIKTEQLILMGDIFDLLVGNSPYLQKKFTKEIELIEDIAKRVEVIYLEGNHDFNLSSIFKNIKVVKIELQPLIMSYKSKTYAISHGDKFATNISYKLYTKLIRNPLLLKILPDYIAKSKLKQMQSKKICKEIKDFKNIVNNITKSYTSDYIIEGHFHQGIKIGNYTSLPSFACSLGYGVF